MQVNLRGLYGRMTEVFLYNPEILGALVEFTCITVTDLMRGNPLRCIVLEYVLDGTGRDMLTLLSDKKRPDDPVPNEFRYITKGILINENGPYFITFPPDSYGMFVKINILNIHITELRYPDTGSIYRPDNKFVPAVVDRIDKTENLAVF